MSSFVSEALEAKHDVTGFSSGVDVLDVWLRRHAHHAQSMRSARTFVLHRGDLAVVGYFSLAPHLVVRAELPPRLARGTPDSIPSVLLARLAIDRSLRGGGLGGELLVDALSRAVVASESVGARLVVVDALDAGAAGFYAHHGFAPVVGHPHRLVQKTSDIAAALSPRPSPGG